MPYLERPFCVPTKLLQAANRSTPDTFGDGTPQASLDILALVLRTMINVLFLAWQTIKRQASLSNAIKTSSGIG